MQYYPNIHGYSLMDLGGILRRKFSSSFDAGQVLAREGEPNSR